MSTIRYAYLGEDQENPGTAALGFMFGHGLIRQGGATSYEITGAEDVSLVFKGGFSYNDKGALKSGVATSCDIMYRGDVVATVTGIDASAHELKQLNTSEEFFKLLGKTDVIGSASDDYIHSGDKGGTAQGYSGDDYLSGGAGKDKLFGGDGDDYLFFNHGRDALDGGTGSDAIVFGSVKDFFGGSGGEHAPDLHIDLRESGFQKASQGVALKLTSIESVATGDGDDKLTGDAHANMLGGGSGGRDTISGGAGDDSVYGGAGADVLKGGAGEDTLYMQGSSDKGVTVSLAKTGVQNTGEGKDKISGFENLTGGYHNDKLIGDELHNHIDGGEGNDTIIGGGGIDGLEGGSGADTFVFNKAFLHTAAQTDIVDFSHTEHDIINLSKIDANSLADGDQDFAFIGTAAFSGVAGQVHWQYAGGDPTRDIFISGDLNGDKVADFIIQLTAPVAPLVASDFVL